MALLRSSPSLLRSLAAAGLAGAATGLRSQMGLAAVVVGADADTLPSPLRSVAARAVAVTAAVGELAVDKYPAAPDRTAATGLVGRLVLGALAGSLLVGSNGSAGRAAGAAVGAGCAVGTAFGGLALRTRLSRRVPKVAVALAEDAAAVTLGWLAVERLP